MKDFKYIKHGQSVDSGKTTSSTKYMQRFKGKRKINIPRIIYAIILIYAAGAILFYIGNRIFFLNGKGVVVHSKYTVQIDEDVSVKNYWVEAGDKIAIGDTLFSYISGNRIKEIKESSKNRESRTHSYLKERSNLIKIINLKKIRRKHISRLYRNKKKQIGVLKNEVYLDVSKRANLEKCQVELRILLEDIYFIEDEIRYLKKHLQQSKLNHHNYDKLSSTTLSNISERRYFVSIVSGTVTKTAREGIIYTKKDKLIEVHKDEGVVIIANVSQSSMDNIEDNTELIIIFSDGVRSKGIVKEILTPVQDNEIINSKELEEMTKIQLKVIPIKGEEEIWIRRIGYTAKIKLSIIF
jgi:hypothetical protein